MLLAAVAAAVDEASTAAGPLLPDDPVVAAAAAAAWSIALRLVALPAGLQTRGGCSVHPRPDVGPPHVFEKLGAWALQ